MNLIQKIKKFIDEKKQKVNAKKYYQILQAGALFIKYVQEDIEHMKTNQSNRHLRRRFEAVLRHQGKLSPEIITHYATKIDQILKYLENKQSFVKTKPSSQGK